MKKIIDSDNNFDTLTLISIICLIIVISGIFGWGYEVVFYYFNSGMKQIYNRGSNFLPWINIYFYGAMLITLFAYKKRKSPLKVFLISLFVCGVLELLSGWVIYGVLNIRPKCWSYNEEILNFGNIGGYICLRSVLFFGVSGLFLVYGIIPFCIYLAKKIPRKLFIILSISLCSIFLLDEIYNFLIVRIFSLPRASQIYKSIGVKYIYFNK